MLDNYTLSADQPKLLVQKGGTFAVIKPEEWQKFEKPLRIAEMQLMVDPMEEWKQILTDPWRLERDYFYDPNMHGVNWKEVKERYTKMIDGAMTREE